MLPAKDCEAPLSLERGASAPLIIAFFLINRCLCDWMFVARKTKATLLYCREAMGRRAPHSGNHPARLR